MLAVQSDRSLTIAILKNLQDISVHDHNILGNIKIYYNSQNAQNIITKQNNDSNND